MSEKKGILFVTIAAILWGFPAIVIRLLVDTISPEFITFVRYGIAGVILLPFLFIKRKELRKLNKMDVILILFIAILGTSIAATVYQTSLKYIGAAVSMFITRLEPVFVVVLATIFLKERINRKILVAIIVALIGSFLVSFQTISIVSLNNLLVVGFLLAVSSAFLWGASLVIAKKLVRKISPITMTSLRAIIGSLFVFCFIFNDIGESIASISYVDWLLLSLLGTVLTAVVFIFYYTGLKYVSASKTSIIILLSPLVTLVSGYFILNEIFTTIQLFGGFLILFAIYIISRERG